MHECALYSDPELYDLLFPSARDAAAVIDPARRQRILASEQFYLAEAKGHVLELGCGSGRLTIPIAQSGVTITGTDLSGAMLAAARAKAQLSGVAVDFQHADMRNFQLPARFDTILIPGNSLLHLHTVEDLRNCLNCVHRHLLPGGKLVFDISKWDPALLARDDHRHPAMSLHDPQRGEITIEERASYDAATQIRQSKLYLSTRTCQDFQSLEYSLRVIFPQELLALLAAASFTLSARFGEFTREAFTSASPRQVCICTAVA